MLNPEQHHICIEDQRNVVDLAIRINQSVPTLIEILRFDLDTEISETMIISSKEVKKLLKQANYAGENKKEKASPYDIRIPIHKTGLYRLKRVVDTSNLEVRRKRSDAMIVQCPSAWIKPTPSHRCLGELSDVYLQAYAVPPVSLKYTRTVNEQDVSSVVLNILPDSSRAIPPRRIVADLTANSHSGQNSHLSIGQAAHIDVPINETVGTAGEWRYTIDHVHDAYGNTVNFSRHAHLNYARSRTGNHLEHTFVVHERPQAALDGCDAQHPLKAAVGDFRQLPLRIHTSKGNYDGIVEHHISYTFTPQYSSHSAGDANKTRLLSFNLGVSDQGPVIQDPGMYSLKSVASPFCTGEILEPASCLLINPPQPNLTITSETISDKCASNSIGLLVSLNFVGTPPFVITYNVIRGNERPSTKHQTIDTMRAQLDLRPPEAGKYTYDFVAVSDALYGYHSLKGRISKLKQAVKPSASARFTDIYSSKNVCTGESASLEIHITGEPPWVLEWEYLYAGKRTMQTDHNITVEFYHLITRKLEHGGLYTLSLTSITDRSGCKVPLKQQVEIHVRLQKPSAAFGQIDGGRSALTLDGTEVHLPLKLVGDAPWTVTYRTSKEQVKTSYVAHLMQSNSFLVATAEEVVELLEVHDKSCAGSIDLAASTFKVRSIPRPMMQLAHSHIASQGSEFVKTAVCEDARDGTEVSFTGRPPFHLKYDVAHTTNRGVQSVIHREELAGLNSVSIKMETSHPGMYKYLFSQLEDQLYDQNHGKFVPVVLHQQVFNRPLAKFADAGRTYGCCKDEESGEKAIPISITGTPPFSIDVEIRHFSPTKSEIINIPNIESNHYEFLIPHRVLDIGTHTLSIRRVQDANGCQRITEHDGPAVRVHIADVPSISPSEATIDYCVGDHISFTLSGTPPFHVFYNFEGIDRKASVLTTDFRRIADRPGQFTISAVSDSTSIDPCRRRVQLTKTIHGLPSVRMSKGKTAKVDIHIGDNADIQFDFGGTPPFEFT